MFLAVPSNIFSRGGIVLEKVMNIKKRQRIIGWGFVLPAAILIFIFYFYPIIRAFILSFQTGVGVNMEYAGFFNYQRLLVDKLFKTSMNNVFIYLILQVPIMLMLALILASLLNDKKLKFRGFFRTALFLPCATSLVAYAIIFRALFSLDGFVNTILMNFNLITSPINWTGRTWTARILIVVALTWRWTGYNMIFYLAGLQNINPSDRKSTRLNSSHVRISYAVFCLKKKTKRRVFDVDPW